MRSPSASSLSAASLSLRMLDGGRRTEAGELWQGLENRLGGDAGLSCSWAWTETWLEHYGDVVAHRFAVADADGVEGPAAIALVTRAPQRWPRPRAWHIGTAGEPPGEGIFVERNRLLADAAARAPFAMRLLGQLGGERGWDRLRLDAFEADDARLLTAAVTAAGGTATTTVEECPVADLQAGDDVLAGLSGSRRQRIRRTLRAFGELELDWAADVDQADAILGELIELHQRRWREAGQRGAFASPRFTAFHRALVRRLVPAGRVALVRVRRGEETVGCLYGFVDGDRLCFYQGGLQRYDDNRLRAGVAAHATFMRACRERGLALYDFLAPATRYKTELASRTEQLTSIEVARTAAWRLRLSAATRALRARR